MISLLQLQTQWKHTCPLQAASWSKVFAVHLSTHCLVFKATFQAFVEPRSSEAFSSVRFPLRTLSQADSTKSLGDSDRSELFSAVATKTRSWRRRNMALAEAASGSKTSQTWQRLALSRGTCLVLARKIIAFSSQASSHSIKNLIKKSKHNCGTDIHLSFHLEKRNISWLPVTARCLGPRQCV